MNWKTLLSAVMGVLLVAGYAFTESSVPRPATMPASGPAGKPVTTKEATTRKYMPVTTQQAMVNKAVLDAYFEKTRKDITPDIHFVQTDHFWVYSAWDKNTDKEFGDVLESMYRALCRQFDIPEKDNIWAGKCGVIFFKDRAHYVKFTKDVDKSNMDKADGYQWHSGNGLAYICMSPPSNRTAFYTLLTHEGTHAFLSRFQNDKSVPSWLNEGLAEVSANMLVKGSPVAIRLRRAVDEAKTGKDIMKVFERVELNDFDYGIAQGFVQFLIAKDRLAFCKMITEIKQGKTDDEALKDCYGWTKPEMGKAWKAAAGVKN